uniref:Uncharacterized protein n=1 Tax=viral metagenome TaxID=1070528 RepID=A0A6C0HBG9_9ZZZZ
MEYAKSFGENVLFNNTNNEMRGGYPIEEIIQSETQKREMLGGSKKSEEFGLSRFQNLVVPIGLYLDNTDILHLQQGSQKETNQSDGIVLGEDIFDKFLDLVSVKHRKGGSNKYTKKRNVLYTRNKTRKNK